MRWIYAILFGVLVAVSLSVLYFFTPPRAWGEKKPLATIFPKYRFPIVDLEATKSRLADLGFKKVSDNTYVRGSYFGDILSKWTKLQVRINEGKTHAVLGSPLIVIAFDTGDLWKIAKELQRFPE